MEKSKVDAFLITNSKYFPEESIVLIGQRLLELDDDKAQMLQFAQFNDPMIILVVSLIVGTLGVDRFMIGDTGLGLLKLFTCGGAGIWSIVDLFLIMKATRQKNLEKLTTRLAIGFY